MSITFKLPFSNEKVLQFSSTAPLKFKNIDKQQVGSMNLCSGIAKEVN